MVLFLCLGTLQSKFCQRSLVNFAETSLQWFSLPLNLHLVHIGDSGCAECSVLDL